MIFLVISILFSTAIYAIFKLFAIFNVRNFQAIAINYVIASGFGFWVAYQNDVSITFMHEPWLWLAIAIGVMFIVMFHLMANISQTFGVSVASVAAKMSMVIPVIFFVITDPDERFTIYKIAGVIFGVVAVYLAMRPNNDVIEQGKRNMALPILLFLGSGILDIFIAYSEKTYLTTQAATLRFMPITFVIAGIVGFVWFAIKIARKQDTVHGRSLFAGMILGLANYASIYYLLKILSSGAFDRSTVFPANNMGIVALSSLMGFLFFKEKLNSKNVLGITLALVAIGILTWGDYVI